MLAPAGGRGGAAPPLVEGGGGVRLVGGALTTAYTHITALLVVILAREFNLEDCKLTAS